MTGAASKRKWVSLAYMLAGTLLIVLGLYSDGWISGCCFVSAFIGYAIGILEAVNGR